MRLPSSASRRPRCPTLASVPLDLEGGSESRGSAMRSLVGLSRSVLLSIATGGFRRHVVVARRGFDRQHVCAQPPCNLIFVTIEASRRHGHRNGRRAQVPTRKHSCDRAHALCKLFSAYRNPPLSDLPQFHLGGRHVHSCGVGIPDKFGRQHLPDCLVGMNRQERLFCRLAVQRPERPDLSDNTKLVATQDLCNQNHMISVGGAELNRLTQLESQLFQVGKNVSDKPLASSLCGRSMAGPSL